jgi:hypothetical protein
VVCDVEGDMRHLLLPLIGLLCAAASWAQEGDPLKSPECRRAMDALQAQEARAASAAHGGPDARREAAASLEGARRQAAHVCLGGRGDVPPPSAHFTQPLTGVPLTTPPSAPQLPPPPAPPARPAAAHTPAAVITSCDATGCWTSEGTRMQRFGPGVTGPRGPCTVQGGVTISCP